MKWYFFMPVFLAAAAFLFLAGCRKNQRKTDEIDGGVVHNVITDAPKQIESTQIVFFSCEFSTLDRMQEDTEIAGHYFVLYADPNGGFWESRNREDIYPKRCFVPNQAFFVELQQIVSQYDLAQYNGQHYTVSGLPPHLGIKLNIRYASGESISASDNQSCFLPLEAMEALVRLFSQS